MTPEELAEVESEVLWAELGRAQGRERVEVLIELANRAMGGSDYGQASSLLEEATSQAEELAEESLAGLAERLRGTALFHGGDYAESAMAYARAAQVLQGAGRTAESAMALWGRADSLRMLGDYQGCLTAATDCRVLAEAEGEHLIAGDACDEQARALYWMDREEDALAACRAGRDHFRMVGNFTRVGRIDDFAVTVHSYLGNLDDALELARSCEILARNTASGDDDAYALRRLAEVHIRRGEYETALGLLERARVADRAVDELAGVARCDLLRSRAMRGLGDTSTALALLSEARVLFDATGYDNDALECRASTAILLHQMGRFVEACRMNREIINSLAHPVGDARAQWALVRAADNLLAAGVFDEALELVDHGRELWIGSGSDADSLLSAQTIKARALAEQGDLDAAAEIARQLLPQAGAAVTPEAAHLYEIVARSELANGHPGGEQQLAHAIALHLAVGSQDRATELSRYFMPGSDLGGDKSVDPQHTSHGLAAVPPPRQEE